LKNGVNPVFIFGYFKSWAFFLRISGIYAIIVLSLTDGDDKKNLPSAEGLGRRKWDRCITLDGHPQVSRWSVLDSLINN
jgi:hypothetical protein